MSATGEQQKFPVRIVPQAEPVKHGARIFFKWKPETDTAIRAYFAGEPFKRGGGIRCFDYLIRTAPHLMVDADGNRVGQGAFTSHIKHVLNDQKRAREIVAECGSDDLEADARVAEANARAAEAHARADGADLRMNSMRNNYLLASELCSIVWGLAASLDAETLAALRDLVGKKVSS